MNFLKFVELVIALFLAACLFCWLFTSHWIFDPIVSVICFLGGILLISFIEVELFTKNKQ
ncbi:hypothetical protein NIES2101_39125 [Calothrix sp. HK-06]|nr:hypothetical protein NIES2101_39125 [Calothrix sp. HK-06]